MSYAPPPGPPPSQEKSAPPPPAAAAAHNGDRTSFQAPPGPPPSATAYTAPPNPPPASDQGFTRSAVRKETTLAVIDRDEYSKLLPYTYLTINVLQSPELFKEYLRSIGKKRKALFGGNKENKELVKDYSSKIVVKSGSRTKKFYSTDDDIVNLFLEDKCLPRIRRLANRFNLLDKEYLFYDLCQICLFDIFFYIDNSGSMNAGTRLQQLHSFLNLFIKVNPSTQPLRLKIMNNHEQIALACKVNHGVDLNSITTEEELNLVFSTMSVSGVTPLASKLHDLIIKPEVLNKKYLIKPILIVMFTDGAPNRDNRTLSRVIIETQKHLARYNMPKKSVCYQIAQIGNDPEASDYLDSLDNDSLIGDVIDCTSPIEVELRQMTKKNKELSNEMNYVKKLLLGAIDMTYDSMDETSHKVY